MWGIVHYPYMPEETIIPVQPTPVMSPVASASLRSPVTLLKDAWGLYTSQIGTYLAIAAIPVVVSSAIMAIGALGVLGTFQTFAQTGDFNQSVINAIGAVILGVVLMIIAAVWGGAAMLAAVTDSDGRTSVGEAYGKGWRMLGAYIWVSILMGVCVLVGFILLIIPGIVVGVWLSLSMYVLAVEGVRGTGALRKSKAYVQGHGWAVFGRLCVLYLLYAVVAIAVGAVESAISVPNEIGSRVVSIIMAPFVATYLFLIYKDLKNLSSEAQ